MNNQDIKWIHQGDKRIISWTDVHDTPERARYYEDGPICPVIEIPYTGISHYNNGNVLAESNQHAVEAELTEADYAYHVYEIVGSLFARCNPEGEALLPELADMINGLHDYPLLDEGDHSDREHESIQEHWSDWGEREFIEKFSKLFQDGELPERLYPVDYDFSYLYWSLCDYFTVYPTSGEDGGHAYFPQLECAVVDGECLSCTHKVSVIIKGDYPVFICDSPKGCGGMFELTLKEAW